MPYGETNSIQSLKWSVIMSSSIRAPFEVGDWRVDPAASRLTRGKETAPLEPKVMDLLVLLSARPKEVFSKEDIFAALWPGVTVGEDTLARAVSKLRKALGDTPKAPRYVETIPKRGYRLIAAVNQISDVTLEVSHEAHSSGRRALVLAAGGFLAFAALMIALLVSNGGERTPDLSDATKLTIRANDFYMRFTRPDNEAAIALYERVIAEAPSYAPAQAGLANALVQRVVRWPNPPDEPSSGAASIGAALDAGLNETPLSREVLSRAQALAERAVRIAPANASALKAAGFVYSAQGNLDRAVATYEKAIVVDPDAWAPLINLGEIYQIKGDRRIAVGYFEKAYFAMERVYQSQSQYVSPWHAAVGVVIGGEYEALGQSQEAEIWYRRVLAFSPLEPEATSRLAQILTAAGDAAEAERLCETLSARIGAYPGCVSVIDNVQASH